MAVSGGIYWYFCQKEKPIEPLPPTNTIIKKKQDTPKVNAEQKVVKETIVVKEPQKPIKKTRPSVGSNKVVNKILEKKTEGTSGQAENPIVIKKISNKEKLEERIVE